MACRVRATAISAALIRKRRTVKTWWRNSTKWGSWMVISWRCSWLKGIEKMTEKDKEINELRREVLRLQAELNRAKQIQRLLFEATPIERLIEIIPDLEVRDVK